MTAPKLDPLPPQCGRPFFSVVIPTRGRPEMVKEALWEATQAQERGVDLEIVVIDDGETPSVGESNGPNYRAFFMMPLSAVGAWNLGITEARGEYIHLLHDDDYVRPYFYDYLWDVLTKVQAKCVTTSFELMGASGPQWARRLSGAEPHMEPFEEIAIGNITQPPAVLFRRELYESIGLYDSSARYAPDWEFYRRAYVAAPLWLMVPLAWAVYRLHEGQGSSRFSEVEKVRDLKGIIDRHEGVVSSDLQARARQALFSHTATNVKRLSEQHKWREAGELAAVLPSILTGAG